MSVVADQPTLDHRVALGEIVPTDYLAWLRRVTLTSFCVYALVWTRDNGILWDRVGIAKAVAIFLACAFIGRPARQWATLGLDLLLYCAMWFAYETTRGAADGRIFGLRFPLQVQAPRNIDRFLFFGHDPNTVLQGVSPGAVAGNLAALSQLDGLVNGQAAMVSYIDDFKLMMIVTLCALPLAFILQRPRAAVSAPMVHAD